MPQLRNGAQLTLEAIAESFGIEEEGLRVRLRGLLQAPPRAAKALQGLGIALHMEGAGEA